MRTPTILAWLVGIIAASVFPASADAATTYSIRRVFSTPDAAFQLVQIDVVDKGPRTVPSTASLAVADATGASIGSHYLAFDDLSLERTTYVVAYDRHGIFAENWPYTGHYPDAYAGVQLFPLGGATLRVLDDAWTFPALPLDGRTMLDRRDGLAPASFDDGRPGSFVIDWPLVTAVEYRNAATGDYFLTANADELAALDNKRVPGYARTGRSFLVMTRPNHDASAPRTGPLSSPVCRLVPAWQPGALHFFSASPDECAAAVVGGATLESSAIFHAVLPDPVTGECLAYTIDVAGFNGPWTLEKPTPLYRVWNASVDAPVHRLVDSDGVRDQLVGEGWVAEGYGPNAVAMCL